MNKKALSTMMAVFLVLAIGAVGYVIGTSSGATGFAVKTTNVDSANVCRYGEKQCGFGASSEGLVFVNLGKNSNVEDYQYGNPEKNMADLADKKCQELGYSKCWAVQLTVKESYLDSNGQTCDGKEQLKMKSSGLTDCNMYGNGKLVCENENGLGLAEPFYGDIAWDSKTTAIICEK